MRWLTDYSDIETQNASRLKAARVGQDSVLLLWETWSRTEHMDSHFAVVSSTGLILTPPTSLGSMTDLRIPRVDDLLLHGDSLYMFNGAAADLQVTVLGIQ